MVADVLVHVGHHGPPSVPFALPDDVDLGGEKGVGGSDDRADVAVVFPVLDGDVELVSTTIEIGDNRLDRPVPVLIEDIAAIATSQELRIEAGVIGPRLSERADTDGGYRIRT